MGNRIIPSPPPLTPIAICTNCGGEQILRTKTRWASFYDPVLDEQIEVPGGSHVGLLERIECTGPCGGYTGWNPAGTLVKRPGKAA